MKLQVVWGKYLVHIVVLSINLLKLMQLIVSGRERVWGKGEGIGIDGDFVFMEHKFYCY